MNYLDKLCLLKECHGVDPNRNFGYHWGGYGASDDACKETYRGPHAFSEPETLAMKNFLLSEKADFKVEIVEIILTNIYK